MLIILGPSPLRLLTNSFQALAKFTSLSSSFPLEGVSVAGSPAFRTVFTEDDSSASEIICLIENVLGGFSITGTCLEDTASSPRGTLLLRYSVSRMISDLEGRGNSSSALLSCLFSAFFFSPSSPASAISRHKRISQSSTCNRGFL